MNIIDLLTTWLRADRNRYEGLIKLSKDLSPSEKEQATELLAFYRGKLTVCEEALALLDCYEKGLHRGSYNGETGQPINK